VNPKEAELHQVIEKARKRLLKHEKSLQTATAELDDTTSLRERFDVLAELCTSLERLEELGGSDLFWGEEAGNVDASAYIAGLRERMGGYEKSVVDLQQKCDDIRNDIRNEKNRISVTQEDILVLKEQEERKASEFVIEREATSLPFRPMVMPWTVKSKDEKRIRLYVSIALLYSFLVWLIVPMIELPVSDQAEKVKIPERLAKLLKKETPKPKVEKTDQSISKKSTSSDKKVARKKAESAGLLAFKDDFTKLMSEVSEANLGASADISNSGQKSNLAARNLVVAKASNVGGINSASLSRNTGGAGSKMSGGIQFSRIESSIGIDADSGDRPTGSGAPPRSDEDIQIIFDRYKGALYRIYQRELRKDPTLQGNMVLRIVIDPDGSVSLCLVESTDMKSPSLSAKIVARVKRFQFGKVEGAPKMTILYPIDFLPAT
jgi:hypothetical protein